MKQKATMLFKIVNHKVDINADHLFLISTSTTPEAMHSNRFMIAMTSIAI